MVVHIVLHGLDEYTGFVTYNGSCWSRPKWVAHSFLGHGILVALSCASASFCVVVGDAVRGAYPHAQFFGPAAVYNGHSWGSLDEVAANAQLQAVDCTSPTFCLAVGWTGRGGGSTRRGQPRGFVVIWNGSSWKSASVSRDYMLMNVSCASSAFCVVTGAKAPSTIFPGDSTFSYRSDTNVALIYHNGSSSQPQVIDSHQLTSISCRSSSLCVAVDVDGDAVTYSSSSWEAPRIVPGMSLAIAIACARSSLCLAGDFKGNVFTASSVG